MLEQRADLVVPGPGTALTQLSLAEAPPCPAYGRDYVKLAAWLFAFLFGPALVLGLFLLVP